MVLKVSVKRNGAFTVECKNTVLSDCYPGMDGFPIRPEKITIHQEESLCDIIYELANGAIHLTIAWNSCEAKISTILSDFGEMPCWLDVLCQAKMSGFQGAFRQGFGMCGPSGNISFDECEAKQEPVDSHGLIALKGDAHHLIVSADRHDRFVNRHQVQFLKSGFPRMFADSQHAERRYSAGFRLENIAAGSLTLPVLRLRSFDRLDIGLMDAAKEIGTAMKARNLHEPAFHWCSWYYLYYNFCHGDLKDYLKHFQKSKKKFPSNISRSMQDTSRPAETGCRPILAFRKDSDPLLTTSRGMDSGRPFGLARS